MSIKNRLILIVLAVLLPSLVATGWGFAYSYTQQRNASFESLREIAGSLAAVVQQEFSTHTATLKALGAAPSLKRGELRTFHEYAREIATTREQTFVLTDRGYQQLLNTRAEYGSPLPVSRAFAALRDKTDESQSVVSDLYFAPIGQQFSYAIQVPVVRDGTVAYWLSNGQFASSLQKLVNDQRLRDGWNASIIDRQGIIVARRLNPEQFVGRPATRELLNYIKQAPEGIYETVRLDGRRAFTAYTGIASTGWTMVVSMPRDDLLGPFQRSLSIAGMVALVLFAVGLLVASRLGRAIVKSIDGLVELASRIGAGGAIESPKMRVEETAVVAKRLVWASTQLHASRMQLESRIRQYRFLVNLDDATRALVDPAEITLTAATLLGTHMQVNRCAYADVEEDQDTFNLTGDYNQGVASIVGRYTFTAFGEDCLRLMRQGEPYIVEDAETDPRAAKVMSSYRQTGIRAVICVPLIKAGKFVAAMAVHQASPRQWTEAEVQLLLAVASRCWESIERTRLARGVENALREADRRKDEFLAMLAHELRNPLAPIRNAAQILKMMRGDERLNKTAEIIGRQVDHMTGLVNDLLDVSRVTRGMISLNRQTLDMRDVVSEAVEQVRPAVQDRRQTLTATTPDRPVYVSGDRTRLVQVLSNLLNNAAKFTPQGGAISIVVSETAAAVQVAVQDNGAGIAPDFLPQVFNLFSQGSRGLDRSQGGLGLGLALVKTLVELHGGSVEAHSQGEGRGSVFLFRLPSATAPLEQPIEAQVIAGPGRRLTVLVVDDNRDGADTLADLLAKEGHAVDIAYESSTALARIRGRAYDVLLLDLGLPDMDGHQLAAEARQSKANARAMIVAVTGYGGQGDRTRTASAGFDCHLVKPVLPHTLLALLQKGASRERE